METVRFAALYSTQIRRKKKAWQDGEAVYNSRKCRLTLKDEKGATLESHWVYKQPRQGDEIMFEGHVVQIEHALEHVEASQPVIVRTTPMAPLMDTEPQDSLQRVLEAHIEPRDPKTRAFNTSAPTRRQQRPQAPQERPPAVAASAAPPAPPTSSPIVVSVAQAASKHPRLASASPEPKSSPLRTPTPEPVAADSPDETSDQEAQAADAGGSQYDLRIEDETVLPFELSSRPQSRNAGSLPATDEEELPGTQPGTPQGTQETPSILHPLARGSTKVPTPEPSLQFPIYSDPRKQQPSLSDLLGPSKQTHSLQHTAESLRAKNATLESVDCEIIYTRKKRTEWLRDVPAEHPPQGAWTWEAYWLVPWRPVAVKQELAS